MPDPKALSWPIKIEPVPPRSTPPEKVLLPLNTRVLAPLFARRPLPEITPENVVFTLALLLLAVRVPALSVIFPAPAIEATVSLPPTTKEAPLATLTAEESLMTLAVRVWRVPALIVVAPV